MIKRKISLNCFVWILAFAIAGCDSLNTNVTPTLQATLEAPLMDRSILTGIPCKAPCWNNLNLGKSTEADILVTLYNLPFVNTDTIRESVTSYWDTSRGKNIEAKLIAAECERPAGQQCVGLIIANATLSSIGLLPNYDITFQEIVDRLGAPDYVRVNLIPPGNQCSIKLIWVSRQIIIEHNDYSQSDPCGGIDPQKGVDSSWTIQSISYVLPEDIELTTIPAPGTDYPWPGFIISP